MRNIQKLLPFMQTFPFFLEIDRLKGNSHFSSRNLGSPKVPKIWLFLGAEVEGYRIRPFVPILTVPLKCTIKASITCLIELNKRFCDYNVPVLAQGCSAVSTTAPPSSLFTTVPFRGSPPFSHTNKPQSINWLQNPSRMYQMYQKPAFTDIALPWNQKIFLRAAQTTNSPHKSIHYQFISPTRTSPSEATLQK